MPSGIWTSGAPMNGTDSIGWNTLSTSILRSLTMCTPASAIDARAAAEPS